MISFIREHTKSVKEISIVGAHEMFQKDETKESYLHFKKYFYSAIFLKPSLLRKHAIKEALLNHQDGDYYLEFGVWTGTSLTLFAKILKKIPIYGFDSFEGLRESWVGHVLPRGAFNLNKKVPKLSKNCIPVVGWVQDTLPRFLKEKEIIINFVHLDVDTYESTKFILKNIKPHLKDQAIIVFDELYNFSGWKVGEYKALTEILNDKEYSFIGFGTGNGRNAVIQYNKIES